MSEQYDQMENSIKKILQGMDEFIAPLQQKADGNQFSFQDLVRALNALEKQFLSKLFPEDQKDQMTESVLRAALSSAGTLLESHWKVYLDHFKIEFSGEMEQARNKFVAHYYRDNKIQKKLMDHKTREWQEIYNAAKHDHARLLNSKTKNGVLITKEKCCKMIEDVTKHTQELSNLIPNSHLNWFIQ